MFLFKESYFVHPNPWGDEHEDDHQVVDARHDDISGVCFRHLVPGIPSHGVVKPCQGQFRQQDIGKANTKQILTVRGRYTGTQNSKYCTSSYSKGNVLIWEITDSNHRLASSPGLDPRRQRVTVLATAMAGIPKRTSSFTHFSNHSSGYLAGMLMMHFQIKHGICQHWNSLQALDWQQHFESRWISKLKRAYQKLTLVSWQWWLV